MDPGASLAAFLKERIIHWSTQHIKALGHMVSEKIFLSFSHDAPGAGPVWTPGARFAGFIKRNTFTLLQTKYESSGPCGFGEEDFFMFFP